MSKNRGQGAGITWKDRFLSSLKQWSDLEDIFKMPHDLTTSLDGEIEEFRKIMMDSPFGTPGDPLYDRDIAEGGMEEPALRAILLQASGKLHEILIRLSDVCESPIEVAMLYALIITGREMAAGVSYDLRGARLGEFDESYWSDLCIAPQAQLGDYRVDFMVTYVEREFDWPERNEISDKGKVPEKKIARKQMIIECDGHDYHERTKEQARRDKERDRTLQSFGYLVYRYTGSEIWEDVFKCAHQAITTLKAEAMKSLQ